MKDAPRRTIVLPRRLWTETWLGLRERSCGKVESAAVWGGQRDDLSEVVHQVYFLDDLSGKIQLPGYHRVPESSLARLFELLKGNRHQIVGDIHTHPGPWVGLSSLDKRNPIEFRIGLFALVLPSFAIDEPSIEATGVHQYSGSGIWRTLAKEEKNVVFKFVEE